MSNASGRLARCAHCVDGAARPPGCPYCHRPICVGCVMDVSRWFAHTINVPPCDAVVEVDDWPLRHPEVYAARTPENG